MFTLILTIVLVLLALPLVLMLSGLLWALILGAIAVIISFGWALIDLIPHK